MRSIKYRLQSFQSILPRVFALGLAALLPVSALCAAPAEPAKAAKTPDPIRVLTFNLRLSTAANDAKNNNGWMHRREAVANIIAKFPDGNGPYDFVGTQETVIHPNANLNQRDFIASRLPGHGVIGRSREADAERGEGMVLYWKKDRWRLDPKDNGTFWLSATPSVPGSKAEGAQCARTAVFGLFYELDAGGAPTGRKVYVYDTHLDHVGEIARQRGAKALLEHAAARKDKSAPVILMGDFNCAPDSPSVRYLLGEKVELDGALVKPPMALVDTFAAAKNGSGNGKGKGKGKGKGEGGMGTFNGFKAAGGTRIDFILVSPELRSISSKIIRTLRDDGGFPSDHFPVEAVVAWRKSSAD